jgi:type I restriction enzyme, S subunit
MEMQKNIPKLRFPEFTNEWQFKKFGALTKRISIPVDIDNGNLYNQIGIRSHGKGIFYKEAVTGKTLGNKRVYWIKENALIVNIVFAWEQAVAKTTKREIGMIASHRFPMYLPIDNQSHLDYLLHFFLTRKGKSLLALASPGGAGRNKTLGQKEFENLKFQIPFVQEQTKIATFLSTIDKKIIQLKKKKILLEHYKRSIILKILSKELRFKDEFGKEFPEWNLKKLSEICVCLDSIRKPINDSQRQKMRGSIPYWGANNIMDYVNDYLFDETIVLLAEDGGNFNEYQDKPIANISHGKCWVNNHSHVLKGESKLLTEFLFYSLVHKNVTGYVSGGTRAKLTKSEMLKIEIQLPVIAEQTKIANFLSAIDAKIDHCCKQIEKTEQWKEGLLQEMFC